MMMRMTCHDMKAAEGHRRANIAKQTLPAYVHMIVGFGAKAGLVYCCKKFGGDVSEFRNGAKQQKSSRDSTCSTTDIVTIMTAWLLPADFGSGFIGFRVGYCC